MGAMSVLGVGLGTALGVTISRVGIFGAYCVAASFGLATVALTVYTNSEPSSLDAELARLSAHKRNPYVLERPRSDWLISVDSD